jgi:outer membrane protein TolC
VLCALALAPSVQADVIYRIDGVPRPQVRAQTLTKELEQQLSVLKAQLEERSQKASLDQALEAGLLNNPQLAVAYSQIQGQQWNLISVRRQWHPTHNISSSSYVPGQRYSTT